ncbi:hypothetical protein JCM10207_002126 [Rhodosporidiobolus poonsookiae]
MPAVPLDEMKWPEKPRILWLEARTDDNFPSQQRVLWALDAEGRSPKDVLCYGEEAPLDARVIGSGEAVDLLTVARETVFLQPPTTFAGWQWPMLLTKKQSQTLPVDEINYEGAFWTEEHQELLGRLTDHQWQSVFCDLQIDCVAAAEYGRRISNSTSQERGSTGMAWVRRENEAAAKRIKQRKQDCLQLFIFRRDIGLALGKHASLVTQPFSPAQPVVRRYLWVDKFTVGAVHEGGPLDRNKARAFTFADLEKILSGELLFSFTPYSILQVWPVLLDKTTSSKLCKALYSGTSATWDLAYNDVLASLPKERWEQILCAQWADFCAIHELKRRLTAFKDMRLVQVKEAAEQRYRQRRRECLVLYELSQLIDLTDSGKKVSVAAVKIEAGPAPKQKKGVFCFARGQQDLLLPPLLPPSTPSVPAEER